MIPAPVLAASGKDVAFTTVDPILQLPVPSSSHYFRKSQHGHDGGSNPGGGSRKPRGSTASFLLAWHPAHSQHQALKRAKFRRDLPDRPLDSPLTITRSKIYF